MNIGLISDSHDNLPKIKKAVQLFQKKNVQLILHAGDYVAPFSLAPLKRSGIEFIGVFGNNDGERQGLTKMSEGRIKEGPLVFEKFGRRIALNHRLEKISKSEKYDFVFYGHTHNSEIKRSGSTLYVNPGECGGWLTGESSVAIIDCVSLRVKLLRL